ncbi:hypothetical protein HPB49_007076 [Dermacentor silvarum]|uniref:Uncharacterized protein n=1 Tax=Dermacentor silvarum TaxID=543639 RepID=A0ACB8DN80_DERSI|nr:hypothetical protein HPB49_007076 [Dermacentor silvarum]
MDNKKRKPDTHCFAPGCRTGYPGHRVENGRKISLFSVPKEEDRRKEWERNLKRKDKPLAETSAVCEKHFAEHFVIRDYVHVIGGNEVRIPRGRPALAAGAVPTLLPDLPAYLSKVLVKPRPERKRRSVPSSESAKKVRLSRHDEQEASLAEDQNVDPNARAFENDEVNSLVPADLRALADSLYVPRLWTKLITPDLDVLVYATTRTRKEPFGIFHEKVSLHPVKEALKMDGSNVTLQAMPGITTRHIQPNNFEKMRVTFAYQLFSDTVLNGLRLYRNDIEAICGSIQPVLTFFGQVLTCMMRDLIEIMSSRFPAKALCPDSAAVDKLLSFLAYLVEWEVHAAGRGGFLSASTTVGLRVTIASVLSLLDYLSQQLEYKFIMTSRLSQDPLENFFGIARQASGCNTHPTPQQFLITVSCLSFYSLAKSVTNGNAEPDKKELQYLRAAEFTQLKDNGGLLYPSGFLLSGMLDISWKCEDVDLGSDHTIITLTIRGPDFRAKLGAARITDWDKMRAYTQHDGEDADEGDPHDTSYKTWAKKQK